MNELTKQATAHAAAQDAGPHVLSVRGLHVHYGRVCALRDVTFSAACGRSIALVGANGAGKSSLMKAIVGLTPSTSGEVHWRGRAVSHSTHEIAYLPQRERIDWGFPLTVRGLVEMGRYPLLPVWRRFANVDHEAVGRALTTMRLTDLADRQIGALSGGQQQRAFIARALAQEAHVLLLDEPFAGLDQPSQATLSELLRNLAGQGCLIMAAHHELRGIDKQFDEVLLLRGRLIAKGAPGVTLTERNLDEAFTP